MLENLSPREREIFDLLLKGVSPKEIAHKLNISYNTVDFHRKKVYSKLDIHSIQELVAKYSTNGKADTPTPTEPENAIPVSETKKKKRLKLLLPVGIVFCIIMLAFSVLLVLVFIRKQYVYPEPKGVIIPINNMGFHSSSDKEYGGNSTSEVLITREKIDGVSIDVLNLKTNLARRENGDTIFANTYTERHDLIQLLRQANGIRFKARGDGKSWIVGFQTIETTAKTNYAQYRYEFGTVRDKVIVVDIPYLSLFMPEWFKQYSFDFNKETIKVLTIETALSVQDYGSSLLQIFDFEIY